MSTGAATQRSHEPGARTRPRLAAFAVLTAAFVAAAFWKPSDEGPILCGFRNATGLACPGCGMTRSLAALAKGQPAVSVKYHAFGSIVALGAIFAWVALGIGLATGRDLLPDLNARRATVFILAGTGLFLAYWLFRLWRGTAP